MTRSMTVTLSLSAFFALVFIAGIIYATVMFPSVYFIALLPPEIMWAWLGSGFLSVVCSAIYMRLDRRYMIRRMLLSHS